MKRILVTADKDDALVFLRRLEGNDLKPQHISLEKFNYRVEPEMEQAVRMQMDQFRFVIYGGLKNARYFLHWVEDNDLLDLMKEKIHLVMNLQVAEYLEQAGIPAILPKDDAKPIDLMEFMLRISMSGGTLYPCSEGASEEMPGLLKELQMPVTEFTVCKPVPLDKNELEDKRQEIRQHSPDAVLFHSRSSVIRTKTAFPELDLSRITLISASSGVTHKLREEDLEADHQAEGSWSSVIELLEKA